MNARGGFGATTCERGFATGGLTSASAGSAAAVATGAATAAVVDAGERFVFVATGVGLAGGGEGTVAGDAALSVELDKEGEAAGCAAAEVWLRRRSVQKAKIKVITSKAAANLPHGTGRDEPSGAAARVAAVGSTGRSDGGDVRFRKDRGGVGTYSSRAGWG